VNPMRMRRAPSNLPINLTNPACYAARLRRLSAKR
jgi:hypothetical protein